MGRKKGAINKHKKEKPHKEKKSKGRPKGSMKQKQKQHHIVNVNINTGDEGNKKKCDLKDYIPSIPNVIFNTSLSIPQGYPIVKQETNPPFYDMNSLLPDYNNIQEPLTKIIKDTIKPQPVEPIQPIRPPQPPQPVQPIRPPLPIKPTPSQPYQPNPQTDQSHPIELPIKEQIKPNKPPLSVKEQIKPEPIPQHEQSHPIYSDNEIKNIYDNYNHYEKQIENFKNKIKNKKLQYKDTEGLGHIIPIENVAKLAT